MSGTVSRKRWQYIRLLSLARCWCRQLRQRRKYVSDTSASWWHFITATKTQLPEWITTFMQGKHRFSPMVTCHFPGEAVRMWCHQDRLMVYLLFRLLRSTFKHLIPETCVSTQGPGAIKTVTQDIKNALNTNEYHYAIRLDIKGYYASINRDILFRQLQQCFNDKIVLQYLSAIVYHAIDNRGYVYVPKEGIPLRSSLSPFFGALYLSPLDDAFAKMDVFYRRFVDDVIILVKNKHQYAKVRKRLFEVLRSLKLTVSPQKTKMGKLKTFHFLGVEFGVSQNPQSDKSQVSATMHKRCCARALSRVVTLRDNAVNAAAIQRYLTRWSNWWQSTGNWESASLLAQWPAYTKKCVPDCAWLGSGLVAFEERLRPTRFTVSIC